MASPGLQRTEVIETDLRQAKKADNCDTTISMTRNGEVRKIRRSFTLSAEAVTFISETRLRRGAKSDSDALEMLLREAMLEAKRQEIDAAYKEYYDTASDEDLAEQREWAEMAGPSMWRGIPE
jgi:hypothetical protein